MAEEDRIDRLQVELGGEVHHRQILVVELAVLLGRVAVAVHQVMVEIAMGVDVAVEIHRQEAGDLQEARIDVAHEARVRETAPS